MSTFVTTLNILVPRLLLVSNKFSLLSLSSLLLIISFKEIAVTEPFSEGEVFSSDRTYYLLYISKLLGINLGESKSLISRAIGSFKNNFPTLLL